MMFLYITDSGECGKHLQSDFPCHRYSKDEVGFGRWRALLPEVIYDQRAKQMTTVCSEFCF